jgi:DNA-binding transcriptional regulator PaaX
VIVVFDIEEKSKSVRNRFREKLKSLGFGMLQKSIWISPLPIGEDMKEAIHALGLSRNAYVMEVSGFIFGDPKELAGSIWHFDNLEEEFAGIKEKVEIGNQLVKNANDRIKKREAKVRYHYINKYIYDLERKKREAMREYLEFVAKLPTLPIELLPTSLRNAYSLL